MTDWIFGIIGTLLYPLFSIIFIFVDALQGLFKIFAGIGDVTITDGGNFNGVGKPVTGSNPETMGNEDGTGLLFYFLNTPLIKNMLISIMVLAIFLVIIFTVMAFIRNAYAAKQKSWQDIVGNAIKGLANFVLIPVCCLLGIWLGNILLIAIDGATSSGGSSSMGRKLFIACAYNANIFRVDSTPPDDEYDDFAQLYNDKVAPGTFDTENKSDEVIADEVKKKFTNDQIADEIDKMYAGNVRDGEDAPDIHFYWNVGDHYNLWEINYLVLVVGGVFMLYVMVGLTYGMIRRLFILLMLYIISPAICAMYPLDDGSAVGNWKKKFISETISAYGAVAGLNIFFRILPRVDQIRIPLAGSNVILTPIIQLLIMVSGLFVVKEIIGMISGFIGAEDAYSKGASLRKQTKDGVKSNLKTAAAKTGAFIGGTSVAGQLARKIPFVGGTMDKAKDGMGRWGTGVKRDEWKGMTDEQKQAAKDESLRDKAYARANKEKYHRGSYEEAEKRIKEDSSLSFGERMKKLKALRGEESENIDKYKNRGIIGAAKKVGSGVGKAGGWVKNTFGDAARAFYEESGISEYVGAGTDAYDKKLKSQKTVEDEIEIA